MTILNFQSLRDAKLATEPFEHFIVPQAIHSDHLDALQRDFPKITEGGSFPLESLRYGPAFKQLADELLGDELRRLFATKFDMQLAGRPATLTVRGQTRLKDGKIHIDSASKLITVLIYLNRDWNAAGGRLRLLRDEHNLEDVVAEVPPLEGALVAFRCRSNAWHGHHPHEGERRSLQLNYVVSNLASRWSAIRHRVSAAVKALRP